jgi:hypothetical protein
MYNVISDIYFQALLARNLFSIGNGLRRSLEMKKYVIERDIPKVGSLEREQLKQASQKSNAALREVGPGIQWVHSYVAGDKTFCIYLAEDEKLIHRHAQISGFPASKVTEVKTMIDPSTGGISTLL